MPRTVTSFLKKNIQLLVSWPIAVPPWSPLRFHPHVSSDVSPIPAKGVGWIPNITNIQESSIYLGKLNRIVYIRIHRIPINPDFCFSSYYTFLNPDLCFSSYYTVIPKSWSLLGGIFTGIYDISLLNPPFWADLTGGLVAIIAWGKNQGISWR